MDQPSSLAGKGNRMPSHPFSPTAKVLVADDDQDFGTFLRHLLLRAGYECSLVTDGAGALAELENQDFDLLISDIGMPGNEHLELVEKVSAERKGFPILLMTGQPSVETAARSVALPVCAYVLKPPQPAELLKLVESSILQYRNLKALALSQDRLAQWSRDLHRIEQMLKEGRKSSSSEIWDSYLGISFRNLLLALMDFKELAETVWRQERHEATVQEIEFLSAIRQTISVLELTRRHFKSKELGELRHQLEAIIERHSDQGQPPK